MTEYDIDAPMDWQPVARLDTEVQTLYGRRLFDALSALPEHGSELRVAGQNIPVLLDKSEPGVIVVRRVDWSLSERMPVAPALFRVEA